MTNPYAAGNPVYNGGTSAPTVGTVDPSGYVQREASQTRSGLAAAAGRRLGIGSGSPVGNEQNPAAMEINSALSKTLQQPQQLNGMHYFPTGQLYPSGHPAGPSLEVQHTEGLTGGVNWHQGMAPPSIGPSQPANPTPAPSSNAAPVGSSPTAAAPASSGQVPIWTQLPDGSVVQLLGDPSLANQGNSQTNPYKMDYTKILGIDPNTQSQWNTLDTGHTQSLTDAKAALDQLLAGITGNKQWFQQGVPKQYENLLDASGNIRSSAYANQVGDLGNRIAHALSGYDTQATNAQGNYQRTINRINNNYNTGVSTLNSTAAADLAAGGGSGNLLDQLMNALGLKPYTPPANTGTPGKSVTGQKLANMSPTGNFAPTGPSNSKVGLPPSQGGTPPKGLDTWVKGTGWVNAKTYASKHPGWKP